MTIAAIVAVLTAVSGLLAAAMAMAVATASVIHGSSAVRMWLMAWPILDAVALVATFAPRSPVWGRIVSRGRPRRPAIALTFDDGPTEPYTSQILDVLRAFDARATFFVLGLRAAAAPATVTRAVADGHEVGNHTWDHAALPLATPRVIRTTIRRTSDLVERVTGVRPRVFRAPFGWRNPWVDRVARGEGCEPIAWTIGVHDTDRPGAAVIERRVTDALKDGAIVLLHDGRSLDDRPDASQVVEALPGILREARRRGLRLLTVSELLSESHHCG
jgi:peptidoglycan/xylan/chitin deacetylase (PgdA/CDA1 family)